MKSGSSLEKALEAFEYGGRKSVDCQVLLDTTFNAFSLLERWETADSNVSSVQSIIELVRQQGHAYFETLDDSISVAICLIELAQDVVQLAGFLLDPACKPEEIQVFVTEMRGYTRDALEKSKHISTAYRKVRKGINQITDSIPGEMVKLERREQKLVMKKEALERRIERARGVKTITTAALAVVSGVATIALPPLILILPIGLPIAILALDFYENRSSKALREREDQIMDCRTGLQELQGITKCLAGLADHVDLLIDFWLRSDTMLETLSNSVERIQGNTARLRLKAIIKQWKSAGEFYTDYATKLKKIQQIECGARSSLRSRTSSSSTRDHSHRSDKDHPRDQKKISSTHHSRGSDREFYRSRDQRKPTSSSTLERRNAINQPKSHRTSSSSSSSH
ncbi:hypothetical protein B0H19DRAFT_555980 [Mycena capillaripes]|nr:hypothetical protein B0H19DRAFT_555980 [Mycena capillaripes]